MRLVKVMAVALTVYSFSYGETVKQLIDYALKNSPMIKSKIYEMKQSEGEIKSAEALPNPEAYVQFGRLYSQSESGFNLTEFSVHQPLKLWGTRKNAVEEALLKKEAAQLKLQFYKNQIAGQVYQLFFQTLFAKEVLSIKKENYNLSLSLHNLVKKSYRLGEETKLNLLRSEKELKLSYLEFKQAENTYQSKLRELSSIVGKEIKDIKGSISDINNLHQIQLENLPEIKYLSKISASIDKAIETQKGLSKPQLGIEFIASEDAAELGKYEFGIGITASVPVFYRNQGEILKLINQKKSVLFEKKQKELFYRSKIKNIKSRYSLLKSQIDELDRQILPSLSQALKLAEKSYKMRAITLFELSDIKKQYFNTLIYRASLLKDVHNTIGEYIKIGGMR